MHAQYTFRDAVAAGAWTWTSSDGLVWVLVDVQSAVPGVVQARVELWAGDTASVTRIGRSEVMPAAAEFGGYVFEDVTGDDVPDFLGSIADSAGVSYPVFIPGIRGAMADQLEDAGRGFVWSLDDATPPQVVHGATGLVCGIQLWAEQGPDSLPAGWRYLQFGRAGLGPPSVTPPACP